jgi:hypothetical protein
MKQANKNASHRAPLAHDEKTNIPSQEKSLPSWLNELCQTQSWSVTYEALIKNSNAHEELHHLTGEAQRAHPLFKTQRCLMHVRQKKSFMTRKALPCASLPECH